MREGQGWVECSLVADRRQESDHGSAPEKEKYPDWEQT